MDLREILEAGIWREKVSAEFYKRLSKRVKGDLKLLLEYMSIEEMEHEKFLRNLYRRIFNREPGEVSEAGKYEMPEVEVKAIEELIEIGIEKERESKRFYMDLFCKLDSFEDKEVVLQLINFEDGHLRKLEEAKKEV
jgi:rubrerythrin